MLKDIKDSFESGIGRLKWFAAIFSERLKVELAVMRLLVRSDDIKSKKDSIAKDIGNRMYALRTKHETSPFKDPEIKNAIREMEAMDSELESLREKIGDIAKAGI